MLHSKRSHHLPILLHPLLQLDVGGSSLTLKDPLSGCKHKGEHSGLATLCEKMSPYGCMLGFHLGNVNLHVHGIVNQGVVECLTLNIWKSALQRYGVKLSFMHCFSSLNLEANSGVFTQRNVLNGSMCARSSAIGTHPAAALDNNLNMRHRFLILNACTGRIDHAKLLCNSCLIFWKYAFSNWFSDATTTGKSNELLCTLP